MKRNLTNLTKVFTTLAVLLTIGVGEMWADSYIDGFGLQFYEDGSNPYNKTNNDIDDDTKMSFGNKTCDWTIAHVYANIKKNGENVCSGTWFGWQIFGPTGTSWASPSPTSDTWEGDYHYTHWGTENSSASRYIELVKNRLPGDYNLQFLFSWNYGGCSDTRYCKYSDHNWKISWTIPEPTITITGASSLVVGASTNITASISNYPVGATLTNVSVSGNIASTASNTGSGSSITVSSVTPNASGTAGITVTVTVTYGSAGTKDYVYTYDVTPPAVSDYTVTPSGAGYLSSGNGTEGSPWLVTYNGTLTLGLSGATQASTDNNSAAEYSTDGGSNYGTTGSNISQTISSITSTSNANWHFRARLKNTTTSSLMGAVNEKIVYWKVPTYTVTLDKNGGGADGSATATHGTTSLSPLSAPTKIGYDVEGYYSKDGSEDDWGDKVATSAGALQASATYTDASSKWNSLSNQTLYTKWTAHTYTITLNKGTGGTNNGTATVQYDASALATKTDATKTGYSLAGYFTAASEGTKVLNANGTFANSTVSGYITSGQWTKAANCTIYAQWTENLTTVTLAASPLGKGSFTIGGEAATSTTAGVTTTSSVTAVPSEGYYVNTSSTVWSANNENISLSTTTAATTVVTGAGTTSTSTLTATFTPNPYSVSFDANGGTGDAMSNQDFTYDVAQNLSANTYTRTGYTFDGWATAADGAKVYDNQESVSNLTATKDGTFQLYAHWQANPYTVTLDVDEANKGTIAGATTSQDVTYDDATTTVPNLPTAANGYAFMGFYTASAGGGTKLINANGTWIASVAGYTDGSKNWVHDGNVTLYAYYKKAEITAITFTGGTVAPPSTSKTVTVTISPTPTGTTTICWRVLYSNDNPLDPQPEFSSVSGNSVSFTTPAAGGAYKVEAILHTGGGCEGTTLDSVTANFQVATEHNVTVQYKDASGNTIQASGSVTGKPLDWTSVSAPDIFGYTFHHWLAGDGITLSEDGEDAKTGARADSSVVSPIYIRAVYDGRLTAVYAKKKLIYLDLSQEFSADGKWDNPYAYFYTSAGYWDDNDGAGAEGAACVGEGAMTQIEGTDIWYYDYGSVVNFCNKIDFSCGDHRMATHFFNTDAIYRGDFSEGTPLFVPHVGQTAVIKNTSGKYYNAGYWVTYLGEKTGYTLRIKDNSTSELIKEIPFTSETKRMTMKAVTDLEASHTYKFEIMRDDGKYYKNENQKNYSNRNDNWKFTEDMSIGTILTTASGNYTFTLGYADYSNDHDYELRVNVTYPVASNDYRLIYKDDVHTTFKPSAVVANKPGGTDIVSYFVRPNSNPILYKQTATVNPSTGAVDWETTATNLITAAMKSAVITKDSVYNFNLVMDEGGNLSVGGVEAYTGNFYIRTDGANNKWDNYTNIDHMMTYSEYSEKNAGYSHYFMAFVENNTNVKCVIANDYSPCISDTLIQQGGDAAHVDASGFITERANIRFMWNRSDNSVGRAYLAAAKDDGSKFLVLRANSSTDMMDKDGNALINSANSGQAGYNHKAPDNSIQFVDNENWIYETNVKIKPSAYVKLYAHYHNADFYYKGVDNNTFDEDNAIQLMTGEGDAELVRVIYDFKTDRLVAAWMPSGNIATERDINADVMFVREHQEDITQLTFSKGDGVHMGAITDIKTAYAVMRFNKWTLNNKSKADGHAPLGTLLSRYERDLFYVSFPFRVSMNEVFGFGTYGKHWIIEYYDGAARAEDGFWADTPTFWRYVTDRRGKFFEPNQGYIIALDLDELGESSEVWNNGVENVELYFPSYGTMPNITNDTVEYTLPEHTCTIGPRFEGGDDRRIEDSHWNVMSVPTYVNTANVTFANTAWNTENGKPNFLYEINFSDKSLTPRSSSGYTYHAMKAYMVQYAGKVTWTSTSVSPTVAPRRNPEAMTEVEFRLELSQNDKMADQTFVRLSNDEDVSSEFVFGEDMSKQFNKTRSNIYTMVSTMINGDLSITRTAGNTLPMTEQTTVVPVGVIARTNGDYTFAIPEGTAGTGVTLFDSETGIRTNLSALTYTVNLEEGTYNNRFVLEISPVQQIPTSIEQSQMNNDQSQIKKVLIDNVLYIVKDGKLFDAQGALVK